MGEFRRFFLFAEKKYFFNTTFLKKMMI